MPLQETLGCSKRTHVSQYRGAWHSGHGNNQVVNTGFCQLLR